MSRRAARVGRPATRLRRSGALGLLLLLALLLLALPAVPAAAGAPPVGTPRAAVSPSTAPSTAPSPVPVPAPTSDPSEVPIDVQVTELLPQLPRPGDVLQVRGRLVAQGTAPVTTLRVRLRVGGRIDSRSVLAAADREIPDAVVRTPDLVPESADLQPGATTPFEVRVPVEDLGLTEAAANGVYPLQVEVRGLVGPESERSRVGFAATYLPWFGSRQVQPSRVAWLLPLVDVPRLTPRGTLLDDALAPSLATDGRLGGLLAAGRAGLKGQCLPEPDRPAADPQDAADDTGKTVQPPAERSRCEAVPVTYGVDPDLLVTAGALTAPYRVAGEPAGRDPHPASTAAATWLSDLRSAVTPGSGAVLALPYADPDVVALSRPRSGLAGDLASARRSGDEVVESSTDATPLPDVAWPPAGQLTPDAVEAAGRGPGSALVLDASALAVPDVDDGRTPGARIALPPAPGAADTGLVVDAGLSALLTPDPATWQGARLAEQRFLAETAIIAAERPGEGRTLLVAPARRATVDPAFVGAAVLDTGRLPWLCPVPLSDVVAGREQCGRGAAQPSYAPEAGRVLLPLEDRVGELDAGYVRRVRSVRGRALQLTGSVLDPSSPDTAAARARLQRGVFRTESSAWRDDRAAGDRATALLRDDVDSFNERVRVLAGSVLLTSKSGSVSVSVENDLDLPVTLRVQLSASNEARLSTQETPLLMLSAHNSVQVAVRAEALTSGRFVVTATLRDRDGNAFGRPAELQVRSTQYGNVALLITGIATGVLLLAAGARLLRRAVRHRRATTAEPTTAEPTTAEPTTTTTGPT